MNLEIFQHIDDVVELSEGKRDVYKLIAEEIKEYFDDHVFDQSKYTLNLIYRIKTVESIREKLLRNSYISKYKTDEEVLANFQAVSYTHLYFCIRGGQMHHRPRYANAMDFQVYFYGDTTPQERETARKLAAANALNYDAKSHAVTFLEGRNPQAEASL